MATVATISIQLDAQTAALRKGFQESAQATKNLGTQLRQSLGSGIMKFNAGLQTLRTTLGAVTSAFASLRQSVGEIAAIGDFADRIEISTQQLQGLQMTAERFGGRAEVVNTALQRMQRRLADAARNGGPLADRLEELGFNVQEMARMQPEQMFFTFADAVSQLGTTGEQTSLIMQAMDTEGVELRNTLAQGGDALREYVDQMVRFGAVSDELIRKAQETDAMFKDLDDRWQKTKTTWATELLPTMEEFVDELGRIGEAYGRYRREVKDVFGIELGGVATPPAGTNERIAAIKEAGAAELKALGDVMRGMETYKKELTEVGKIRSAVIGAPLQIPGVGAVTSATTQGFSALHDAQRRAQQRAAWEKDVLGVLTDMRDLARARPEPVPVSIL